MGKIINSWKASIKGLKTVAKTWQFWAISIPVTLFFIFLFNLLSTGNNFLNLIIALPFPDNFVVVGQVYQEFATNILSIDKILILIAAFGQGAIIATIVFLWRSRRKLDDKAILESAGASLIALIGAGCPMCGGTILFPILLSIFGAGAATFLQSISWIIMVIAIAVIIFALQRLGFLCYMQPKKKPTTKKEVSNEKKEEINEKS